ncbi:MAG: DUF5689 domain-containing protein [Bacteroidales bacterium]|nr:DUF5689 domain-containing protein [Bacteroidales bacterium]MCF8403121.1 DUF5689 domain-containing protein [Bacteroidales bacterium]
MKRALVFISFIFISATILLISCIKDEVDDPPFTTIKFDPDKVVTIGELKNLFEEVGGSYTIEGDASFYANVGMDEASGNIYKASYVQDNTGGINLLFYNAGGLYLGDSIRVNLNGALVSKYHELYQIEKIDVGPNIFKIATNRFVKPAKVTIEDLKGNIQFYQSTVIEIEDVQFTDAMLGQTFADSVTQTTENKYFRDCFWDSLIVRTSGFANFANTPLPESRGKIIAIASVYDSDVQLVVRNYSELEMNQSRCSIGSGGSDIYFEDFDEGWNGWTEVSDQGAQSWSIDNLNGIDGTPCAQINGFYLGYNSNSDWLISPEIDITGYSSLSLNFMTSKNYDGDRISVMIREAGSTVWVNLDLLVSLSEGGFKWTHSGYINILNSFTSPYPEKIQIGFLYTSTNDSGSEWRVDNVKIKGK